MLRKLRNLRRRKTQKMAEKMELEQLAQELVKAQRSFKSSRNSIHEGADFANAVDFALVEAIDRLQRELCSKILELEKLTATKKLVDDGSSIDLIQTYIPLLAQDPRIAEIHFVSDYLVIVTNEMWVKDPRTKRDHFLGRLIVFSDTTNVINTGAINTCFRVHGTMHDPQAAPHVMTNDAFCLGTTLTVLGEAKKALDPFAYTMILLQFLESVNIADGAGKGISLWPFRDKGIAKVIKKDRVFPVIIREIAIPIRTELKDTLRKLMEKYAWSTERYQEFLGSLKETNETLDRNITPEIRQ